MKIHPSNDALEKFSLGLLTVTDSCRVQRHLFRCGSCLKRLIAIETKDGKPAGKKAIPPADTPLSFTHDTADGPFHSQAEPYLGIWRARHWGHTLMGMHVCSNVREANEYLVESFNQMFPEHRCNARCRVDQDV
jgi:hypothetical protein